MTPTELLALRRLKLPDPQGVEPGEYAIDVTVRVHGTIKVGAPTERAPTVSIPVREVLALFVARSGATREASIALLRSCLTDALRQGPHGVGAIEGAAMIDAAWMAEIDALTRSLPPTPVAGAVRTRLEVVEVDPDPEPVDTLGDALGDIEAAMAAGLSFDDIAA